MVVELYASYQQPDKNLSINMSKIYISQTTVSYETKKLSEIEFPMYFSLVPDPGYNRSILEKYGMDGEWTLFYGGWVENGNSQKWCWGGKGNIEGIFNSLVSANL